MARLVTIEEARRQARATPYHHPELEICVGAAEQAVEDFLDRKVYPTVEDMTAAVLEGSAGEDPMVVNDAIRKAILMMASHLFNNPDAVITGTIATTVPLGYHNLLWPHRVGLGI